MSVPTYPFTWPTEASFKPLDEAFGTAFNELAGVVDYARRLTVDSNNGSTMTAPPTFETVGVLYNALDCIRMDVDQCARKADELEKLLAEVNCIRRDMPVREVDDVS